MLVAAIPFGVFFFLGWLIPDFGGDIATNPWPWFWYYAIIAILFHTFYTCFNLPYAALTPELTEDYNERTSLNSFRFTFSISGSILALVLAQIVFNQVDDPQLRFAVVAGGIAILAIIPIFLCVWGTEERYSSATEHQLSVFDQIKVAFGTKSFLFVIGIYLASWLAFQLTASIIPFYAEHWMGLEMPPHWPYWCRGLPYSCCLCGAISVAVWASAPSILWACPCGSWPKSFYFSCPADKWVCFTSCASWRGWGVHCLPNSLVDDSRCD